MLRCLPYYLVIFLLAQLLQHASSTTGPIVDEVLLSPLALLPTKSCSSKMEYVHHLTCCKRTCEIQPMDGIRPPVIHDIFIECFSHNRTVDCSNFLTSTNIDRIERELGTNVKHPIRKEVEKRTKKEMKKFDFVETLQKILKWYARLFLNWLFHKSFDRIVKVLLEIAKAFVEIV